MPSSLDTMRRMITASEQAVRWACTLEATAPKLGNVHPTAPFADLRWSDFAVASDLLADSVTAHPNVGSAVLAAVRASQSRKLSNVNLGIALLIAPLHRASENASVFQPTSQPHPNTRQAQQLALAEVLAGLSPQDAADVFAAIRLANPGGLGESPEMDVRDTTQPPDDLLAAMRLASTWDLIARQYASGFDGVYSTVTPILEREITAQGDLLIGICHAQLALLAEWPDTLIARKCGDQEATRVQLYAQRLLQQQATFGDDGWQEFDDYLRADGNRRNPGAIADLIAAGLYVLLSTPVRSP